MARLSSVRSTINDAVIILLSEEILTGARELSRLCDIFADERGRANKKAMRAMARHAIVEAGQDSAILALKHFRPKSPDAFAAKSAAADAATPRRSDGTICKVSFGDRPLNGEPWQQLAASLSSASV